MMSDILFEDNHLLVVEKPRSMPVAPDDSGDESLLDELKAYIKQKYSKPGNVFLGLVHRLDRPVGGVMVFAKTSKAAARLCSDFKAKSAKKHYVAVVEGTPDQSVTLTNYIQYNDGDFFSKVYDEPTDGAKLSRLSFKCVAHKDGRSLLYIELKTGRHHQIRAQLAHFGYPIIGDHRYNKNYFNSEEDIALFACELEINHPISKDHMRFCSLPSFGAFADFYDELCVLLGGAIPVYIDDNIIIVDKPKGIEVSEEDSGNESLQARLSERMGEIYAVHRLDRNTTGLVMFARTEAARDTLERLIAERRIKKLYQCEVVGRPQKSSDILTAYLVKDARGKRVYIYDSNVQGAQKIITGYNTLRFDGEKSLLSVELFTGRTHQIRAHLAHIGLPIVGDDKYGDREYNRRNKIFTQRLRAVKLSFDCDSGYAPGLALQKTFEVCPLEDEE